MYGILCVYNFGYSNESYCVLRWNEYTWGMCNPYWAYCFSIFIYLYILDFRSASVCDFRYHAPYRNWYPSARPLCGSVLPQEKDLISALGNFLGKMEMLWPFRLAEELSCYLWQWCLNRNPITSQVSNMTWWTSFKVKVKPVSQHNNIKNNNK